MQSKTWQLISEGWWYNGDMHQPFCDHDLDELVCTDDEFLEIAERLEENANRSLKFSDTVITITALDLHKYVMYRGKNFLVDGYKQGTRDGFIALIVFQVKWAAVISTLLLVLWAAGCFS